MAGIEHAVEEAAGAIKKRRRLILTIILAVVGLHILGGLVAGVVVVARYIFPPPATFVVQKDIRLPAKKREHRMSMASFDALSPKPSFNDKLQSSRPAPLALPELPKLPLDQMMPLDPSAIVTDQVSSLVGAAGLGGGGGGGSGGFGGGTGTGFSFMGVKSAGKRILLLFDVSTSVANKASASGMPLSRIKEETLSLIDSLPASSRFGIIQFTQNYKAFREELSPATDENREAVRRWVETEWVETGTMAASYSVRSNPRGLVGVLELAAKMQPDVVFLISDASFQWRPESQLSDIPWNEVEDSVKALQSEGGRVPFNFIGFEMKPADKREIGLISRKTGGKLREIKK